MAAKKKTASGPKAKLMKKNLAQLKAQAKKLKIKGFSTKKKEALVNSIMMAQARNNKGTAKRKTMAEQDYTPTGTRKSINRMAKKRGAPASRVMRNPATTGRVMMNDRYNGWTNYETWWINLHFEDYYSDLYEEMRSDKDIYMLSLDDRIIYFRDLFQEVTEEQLTEYRVNDLQRSIIEIFLSEVNYYEIAKNIMSDYE